MFVALTLDLKGIHSFGVTYRGPRGRVRGAFFLLRLYGFRGGSVCLNSFGRFAKWISASIMPPPSLVSAR